MVHSLKEIRVDIKMQLWKYVSNNSFAQACIKE